MWKNKTKQKNHNINQPGLLISQQTTLSFSHLDDSQLFYLSDTRIMKLRRSVSQRHKKDKLKIVSHKDDELMTQCL